MIGFAVFKKKIIGFASNQLFLNIANPIIFFLNTANPIIFFLNTANPIIFF